MESILCLRGYRDLLAGDIGPGHRAQNGRCGGHEEKVAGHSQQSLDTQECQDGDLAEGCLAITAVGGRVLESHQALAAEARELGSQNFGQHLRHQKRPGRYVYDLVAQEAPHRPRAHAAVRSKCGVTSPRRITQVGRARSQASCGPPNGEGDAHKKSSLVAARTRPAPKIWRQVGRCSCHPL